MKYKILVVDDDSSILDVMMILLSEHGYEALPVSNADRLMERVREEKPDLIILDLMMSGFDGKEITKQLKSDKSLKKIPVIIVSALNDTEEIAHAVGADDFLEKPFEIQALLDKTKKLLA